jgi:hypothetical protein
MEKKEWDKALAEIKAGRQLAQKVDIDEQIDLIALADTWQARALMEVVGRQSEADACRNDALTQASRCSGWIRMRIYLVAGGMALKGQRYEEALSHYRMASAVVQEYGGEGNSFQIEPRIGLVHLHLDNVDEAERQFTVGRELEGRSIDYLYGLTFTACTGLPWSLSNADASKRQRKASRRSYSSSRNGPRQACWGGSLPTLYHALYEAR